MSAGLMDVVSDLRGNSGVIFAGRSGDRYSRDGRKIGPALADERMVGWHLTANDGAMGWCVFWKGTFRFGPYGC